MESVTVPVESLWSLSVICHFSQPYLVSSYQRIERGKVLLEDDGKAMHGPVALFPSLSLLFCPPSPSLLHLAIT